MKTKNAKSTFIAITLAMMLTLGLSNLTLAQQGKGKCNGNGPGPKCMMHQKDGAPHCMNLPDLTEEQQKKIKELHLKQMKGMLPLQNELKEKQAHLKTLTTKDKVDMTAVNATIDEIAVLKAKMMKQKAAHQQEVRNLLTEEQRLIFDTKPNMKGQCNGHGNSQGMGRGQGKGYHKNCPNMNKSK